MSCSCSRQIAAGEHVRRGEVLMLFGFVPCECVAPHVTEPEEHGTAIEKSVAALSGVRIATWGQVEREIEAWIVAGTGHALLVGIQSLSIPNRKWRLFASAQNVRCTNIAIDTLGFECTDAAGNVTAAGRRLHLRHPNHSAMAFRGRLLKKAWVHESAPQWLKTAQAVVAPAGEVIQWA